MNEKKFHVGVKALIRDERGRILILKANPKELKGGKAHWDLPGGRIKEGDTTEQTLRTEIKEELGIDGSALEIFKNFDTSISNMEIPIGNEKYGLVLMVYLCGLKKKQFSLSNEHTEYKWATPDEASNLLAVKFSKSFIERLQEI